MRWNTRQAHLMNTSAGRFNAVFTFVFLFLIFLPWLIVLVKILFIFVGFVFPHIFVNSYFNAPPSSTDWSTFFRCFNNVRIVFQLMRLLVIESNCIVYECVCVCHFCFFLRSHLTIIQMLIRHTVTMCKNERKCDIIINFRCYWWAFQHQRNSNWIVNKWLETLFDAVQHRLATIKHQLRM